MSEALWRKEIPAAMSKPMFSVLIPTFNRRHTLIGTLESVRLQTIDSWEIVLMDDGSTDGTGQAIEEYLGQHPEMAARVNSLKQNNAGKSNALNSSIPHLHGEWTAFLDSDDVWLPEKLERQRQALEKYRGTSDACFTNARYVNHPGMRTTVFDRAGVRYETELGILEDPIPGIIRCRYGIPIQSLIVRTELVRKIGFDPAVRVGDDWDFIFRLAHFTKFCFVNMVLVEIDRTPQRPVGLVELMNKQSFFLEERRHLFQSWLDTVARQPGPERKLILGQLSALHSEWVNYFLEVKDYRSALDHAERSFQLDPSWRRRTKLVMTKFLPSFTGKLFRNEDLAMVGTTVRDRK